MTPADQDLAAIAAVLQATTLPLDANGIDDGSRRVAGRLDWKVQARTEGLR
jgi:hypothetical protein